MNLSARFYSFLLFFFLAKSWQWFSIFYFTVRMQIFFFEIFVQFTHYIWKTLNQTFAQRKMLSMGTANFSNQLKSFVDSVRNSDHKNVSTHTHNLSHPKTGTFDQPNTKYMHKWWRKFSCDFNTSAYHAITSVQFVILLRNVGNNFHTFLDENQMKNCTKETFSRHLEETKAYINRLHLRFLYSTIQMGPT